jgi:serine phosphatase RsbU (regulator of sigma subunit)/anti-sigma regulatory factor (Ser/Thr protein kinase)
MLTWKNDAQRSLRAGGGWRRWFRRERLAEEPVALPVADETPAVDRFEINKFDPLLAYLEMNPRVTPIERIPVNSPALDELRAAGITVIVPLVNQGKLLGTINLGPRMSGQGYSSDDLTLLENLASQSAAALRVAQLVRQQQAELQERERIDQQLRLARDIQKTLLPKSIPDLPGWRLAAYYQPAWEVGGDFYDFIHFPDGRLGIIIGDVTDKGVASALVMATTRSLLRGAAERERSPAAVLRAANHALVEDIPPNMFVTCFYLLLEPETGRVNYANAGHDLPYRRGPRGVEELRATGMPLGLLPDISYDEYETVLEPGELLVFYSDGLVEAHDQTGDMFGFPRLQRLLGEAASDGVALIRFLLDELTAFTGPGWRQEDDVTLVTVSRLADEVSEPDWLDGKERVTYYPDEQLLTQFSVPSAPGNERLAIERVVAAIADLGLPTSQVDRLRTAVGEAVMNGMEHGNRYHEDLPVDVAVYIRPQRLIVRVTDAGTGVPLEATRQPDLEAKLAGEEPPRGWGLFLIRSMVDEMNVRPGVSSHTTELVFYLD